MAMRGPGAKGSVMTVNFELDDRQFTALNGGPRDSFTRQFHFSSRARRSRKSTITGTS
jgi:predicted 3-demethylubiquinone-9 3-methyltransferase (glyoxalase superfamily)